MQITPVEYDIRFLLEDLLNAAKSKAADSRLRFAVKVDADIPKKLYADEAKVREALLCVVDSVIKNTVEGHIALFVSHSYADSDTVNLTFEMTGGDAGTLQSDLIIVRDIAAALDGSFSVKPGCDKGSVVTAVFPHKCASREPIAGIERPDDVLTLVYEQRDVYADALAFTMDNLYLDYTAVNSDTDFRNELVNYAYDYLFIAYPLYKSNKDVITNYAEDTKVIILADYDDNVTETDVSILTIPVYCGNVAGVVNGAHGGDKGITFTAPGVKILVVDDVYTNLVVTEGLLKPYDVSVSLQNGGEEALEAIKEERFDLVFMDHKMPGMDGIEVTRRIREIGKVDPHYSRVPIISLTANAVAGTEHIFLENGFNDILHKPIDTSVLNVVLDKWLPQNKKIPITSML